MASRLVRLESLPSSPPALSFGTHHRLGPLHAILWRYGGVEGQANCCHRSSCLHCTGGRVAVMVDMC